MTRELMIRCINSDIDILKGLLNRGVPIEDKIKKEIEIKTEIVETLKAEPCDEQSVYMRAYREGYDKGYSDGDFFARHEDETKSVENMPSVTPERSRGKTNKTEKIIEDIKREIRSVKYSEGMGFDDFSHGFIKMNSLALEIIDKYSSGHGMCFNCYSKTDTCQEGLYCPMDMKGGV